MADPTPRSAWPQIRRGLVIFSLLAGGMAVISLLGGRRGDFEAGLLGAIVCGLAGAVVVAVELIGRRLARKQSAADGQKCTQPGALADRSRE
jgi:hypothetical protein